MNVYAGLLFQGGYIADPKLAISLARSEASIASEHVPTTKQGVRPSRLRWFFEELLLLGGRPVSRHHLDDLEEPIPPLHGSH